ncbi:MAG TPA: hypothetical protein VNS32_14935, partial [Flavisolibacter sp.]|nr:hypothetical protein [Flavisolibacter sp.]
MRQVLFFSIIVALILQACKKTPVSNPPLEPTKPAMVYKNLKNAIVSVGHPKTIDIENDGISDFGFGVMLVGDPILQRDRLQFYVNSKVDRNLLNDEQDQSPMLNRSAIVSSNFPGYSWYQISHILLAEKITNFSGSSWDGLWKNASHH